MKKFLFLITARSGSKGIPHKNIKDFCGKPLLAWSIEEAKKSKYCSKLVLSSDSEEYLSIGKNYGCDSLLKRPKELSLDTTSSTDVVLDVIKELPGYDFLVLLQPTSPFRKAEDIDNAIEILLKSRKSSCASVKEVTESPYWMFTLNNINELDPLIKQEVEVTRRQELPNAYMLNGAIYINEIANLQDEKKLVTPNTIGYIMSSFKSVDIDTQEDWDLAEYLFKDNFT